MYYISYIILNQWQSDPEILLFAVTVVGLVVELWARKTIRPISCSGALLLWILLFGWVDTLKSTGG